MQHDEIVEEITRLSETTAQLKHQFEKPKSRLDRFKEYAGVISLLLSLVTGFFAVYTSFWAEPEKSRADAQAKLHDTLAQIVTLDQEYMREIQQNDPNANNGALESKRNILLQQAEDLANKRGVASAEDHFNLGNEYEFGRRLALALSHFKAARQLSGKDSLMKASADTRIGKLNFYGISNTTKEEGRQHFEEAEQILGKPTTMQAGIALIQSLGILSWVECSFGDPALGVQARAKAQDELAILASDPAVSPQLIDTYKVSLANGFINTHCTEPSPATAPVSEKPPPASVALIPTSNKIDLSNQTMRLLVARDYAAVEANMTANAKAQVPEPQLQSIWERVSAITGPYKRTLNTKTNIANNTTFYIVHAQCEKALVNLALAFDETNRISFILLTPQLAMDSGAGAPTLPEPVTAAKPKPLIASPPPLAPPAQKQPLESIAGSSSDTASASGTPARLHVSELPQSHVIYPVVSSPNLVGNVYLRAVIGADGTVKGVTVLSGKPKLAEAGIQAVRQWRYSPYEVLGHHVEVETNIKISFFGENTVSISSPSAAERIAAAQRKRWAKQGKATTR